MSVVRGRPPGLAGGISGASRAYCSSLRACLAPKSPTKARLSAVHTARLQEGLPPSLTLSTAASAHARPDGRASQTASDLDFGHLQKKTVAKQGLGASSPLPLNH